MSSKGFRLEQDFLDRTEKIVVGTQNFEIKSTEIELDGVFEDPEKIIVVETKDKYTNFVTKYLYYLYRVLANIAEKVEKTVYSVFLQLPMVRFTLTSTKWKIKCHTIR